MQFDSRIQELSDVSAEFDRRPELTSYDFSEIVERFFETSRFRNLSVDVLRLDKVHPFVSGNKWFKLKHHLFAALSQECSHLVSFGGPYSNHLHALAFAGNRYGFQTTGFVRGQAPSPDKLSPTLQDCMRWGMKIQWLDRQDYRRFAVAGGHEALKPSFPKAYFIPEGGEGALGLQGVRELAERFMDELDEGYDLLVTPVGSGTTMAGLIAGSPRSQRVVGVSSLKGALDLEQRIAQCLPWCEPGMVEVWHDYHQGGFAKMTPLLKTFISEIQSRLDLLLDPIYTSKALYALVHQFAHHKLGDNVRALFLHTGGLQGWRGYSDTPRNEA